MIAKIKTVEYDTNYFVEKIKRSFVDIHRALQEQAPKDSTYRGIHNWRPVDFIFVQGIRTRTNTNKLFSSVRRTSLTRNKNIIDRVYVLDTEVPYYQKAVLSPMLERYWHPKFGRFDYGLRYSDSRESPVKNRNYMYYMRAKPKVEQIVKSYSGEYRVSDSIEEWI